MICNTPIRVKFVIVNVNTVEIQSSQQNVALFGNGELRLQLSFLDIEMLHSLLVGLEVSRWYGLYHWVSGSLVNQDKIVVSIIPQQLFEYKYAVMKICILTYLGI